MSACARISTASTANFYCSLQVAIVRCLTKDLVSSCLVLFKNNDKLEFYDSTPQGMSCVNTAADTGELKHVVEQLVGSGDSNNRSGAAYSYDCTNEHTEGICLFASERALMPTPTRRTYP